MRVVKVTVKAANSDDDSETLLKFLASKEEYDRAKAVGKMTKQVVVLAVFTEDEFLEFSDYFTKENS